MNESAELGKRVTAFEVTGLEDPEWEQFLEEANTGTLFHSLRFLQYHPKGRLLFAI